MSRETSTRMVLAIAGLMALAWAPPAPAASDHCVPLEQPQEPVEAGDINTSSVRLRLVEPANDAAVDADSIVVVEVDYRVADFQPGRYGLMISFPAVPLSRE